MPARFSPPPNGITFSGRDGGDPALPVGFEDQLFATLRSGVDNVVIPTTFTSAFVEGNILQTLFVAILFGIAMAIVGDAAAPTHAR